MKHEWRKLEKNLYLPKAKPEVIDIPAYKFITIHGEGNPNTEHFKTHVEALYSISYAIKMNLKKLPMPPKGYTDYTVYPLEGVWDINEAAKKNFNGQINKDDLVFTLMIRQPDFVESNFFNEMLELTKKKKPNPLLDHLQLEIISEGKCVQMMHIGSYDDEPASFKTMEAFAEDHKLSRLSKIHREIYISDFRKVAPEKLKTVLRFQVTTE
ncbi:GyrI-like domain-containing protein [Psychroserpens sp. SPM9]|uniref:GyrI-like domain-containing protein n=1 Tax=Psychroserpens sp. SPM9 TaxID=2975598 RepID=UPI0021A5390F|nr:GyrI-like domain-containing protein [Psychroserpens sp. SPM9]MDG5492496.1 GyrI-like domain-containing protein [Psychroserpens sp. SPM9]